MPAVAPRPPTPAAPVSAMVGPKVLISTSMGDIVLQLDQEHAPQTVVIERDLFTVETQVVTEVSAAV